MNETTTVFLIPEEAQKFLEFQKNYKTFMLLLNQGVFDQRNATISLYFDHDGTLQTIIRNDFLYKRMKNEQ